MMDTPLTLDFFFRRAESLFPHKELITATATGIERSNYGQWADRTRRLGGALNDLGIKESGQWEPLRGIRRHLELYFAVPCSNRVLPH